MRKWMILLCVFPLVFVSASIAGDHLAITIAPSQISIGETLHVYFTVPVSGEVSLTAVNSAGVVCATLMKGYIDAGSYDLVWDGAGNGRQLPQGEYIMYLSAGGLKVDMDFTILSNDSGIPIASIHALSEEGLYFSAEAAPDNDEPNAAGITPAYRSEYSLPLKHEACYWCTPMDISNENAVWAMLVAPVIIVEGEQKSQVVLRAEPSDDSQGVGVVTCASQSVHVLETREDGWSLVECYSSSFHDSKVKAWNKFVMGYIKTNKLKERRPAQDYGIVIDKLTQTLYLFSEGRLISTLLVSTGLYNDNQPYNETRSGEFFIVSRVGEFRSDRMFCSWALRFNSGDLLHEVPHVKNGDGSKNYQNTEPKLGTRASHGCIRTQRLKNAQGINMLWLWNNISLYTKMVIWEDYAGRQIPLPDSNITLYYNPNGGSNYHAASMCGAVRNEYLPFSGSFTYGELNDSQYKKLTRCMYCTPPLRPTDIEAINAIHLTESPGEVPQHLRQGK